VYCDVTLLMYFVYTKLRCVTKGKSGMESEGEGERERHKQAISPRSLAAAATYYLVMCSGAPAEKTQRVFVSKIMMMQ